MKAPTRMERSPAAAVHRVSPARLAVSPAQIAGDGAASIRRVTD